MEKHLENSNQSILMRELSDIKAALAVNTNETANIKQSIGEIKVDIKDVKSNVADRITALENEKMNREDANKMWQEAQEIIKNANEAHTGFDARIRGLENWKIWVMAYTSGIAAVIYFALHYIFGR